MIEDIKMKAATDVAKKLLKLARVKELASRQYKDPPRGNGVMDAKHFKSGYTIRAQEIMGKKLQQSAAFLLMEGTCYFFTAGHM